MTRSAVYAHPPKHNATLNINKCGLKTESPNFDVILDRSFPNYFLFIFPPECPE